MPRIKFGIVLLYQQDENTLAVPCKNTQEAAQHLYNTFGDDWEDVPFQIYAKTTSDEVEDFLEEMESE